MAGILEGCEFVTNRKYAPEEIKAPSIRFDQPQ